MNVSLRPLEDRDLDAIYEQVTDPESVRMAAFTAADQTDRRALLGRTACLLADTSVSYRGRNRALCRHRGARAVTRAGAMRGSHAGSLDRNETPRRSQQRAGA
jgi:hypothetical protein